MLLVSLGVAQFLLSYLLLGAVRCPSQGFASVFCYYHMSFSFVKFFHQLSIPFLKRWSGLRRSVNPSFLFDASKDHANLKIKRLTTVWKQALCIKLHLLKLSSDDQVNTLYKTLLQTDSSDNSNRFLPCAELKCSLTTVRATAEATASTVASKHAGLGFFKQTPVVRYSNPDRHQRHQVSGLIRDIDSKEQICKLRSLQLRGDWIRWDDASMKNDLSWKKLIYGVSDRMFSILVGPTTSTLPARDNLHC